MADAKISALSSGTALAGTEAAPFVQGGATVQITGTQIKTFALTTPLAVVGNSTAGAELRLPEDTDNGSNYVAIKAPDNLAATYTLTLPIDDGSADQYLKTDGSGGLSWATISGASAPLTLASGTLTDPSTALTITQTWNDAADTFVGMEMTITNTNSAAASRLLQLKYGAAASEVSRFDVHPSGGIHLSDGTYDGYLRVLRHNGATHLAAHAIGANVNHNIYANTFVSVVRYGSGDTDFDIRGQYNASTMQNTSNFVQYWSDSTTTLNNFDLCIARIAAGVLGVRGSNTSSGAALNFLEQTAPSAPSANEVVVYAEDNGSGKTRLMARFNTGAAQVLATEP